MCNTFVGILYQSRYIISNDISGILDKLVQLLNIPFMLLIFLIFQLLRSGKLDNDEQLSNNPSISFTFSVLHFDISDKEINDKQ